MSYRRWDLELALFTECGFSEEDATGWLAALDRACALPDRGHAVGARMYVDVGFTPESAAPWWLERLPAAHARIYTDAGWTVDQILWLYFTIDIAQLRETTPQGPPRPILDWIATRLPPDRVLRLVRAGVQPSEAHVWAEVDNAAVEVFAALRRVPVREF